jgi:hypothetical protein
MEKETTIENGIVITKMYQEDLDLATQDQNQQRLNVCNTCEHKGELTCNHCGCLLEQLMMYKVSQCPLEKW